MQDSASVISQATNGIVDDLQEDLDLSNSGMYALLDRHNPLPRIKKLVRSIGRVDKSPDKWRVRLIKADLDAMFEAILGEGEPKINVAEFHRKTSAAAQAIIEKQPSAIVKPKVREMLAAGQKVLETIDSPEEMSRGEIKETYIGREQ